jgi:DNA primase small subunit
VSDVDLQRLHKNVVHPDDKFLLHELVLQFAYPRLDINVTKGVNHLLKSPFCVHPKTGKIAVPLNTRIIDTFNISAFPTLA